MSAQDVVVVVSAAWLMGAYTTALVAAYKGKVLMGLEADMTPSPDFQRLAVESPWSAQAWRMAWRTLGDRTDVWPAVVEMVVKTWQDPVTTAGMIRGALKEEV